MQLIILSPFLYLTLNLSNTPFFPLLTPPFSVFLFPFFCLSFSLFSITLFSVSLSLHFSVSISIFPTLSHINSFSLSESSRQRRMALAAGKLLLTWLYQLPGERMLLFGTLPWSHRISFSSHFLSAYSIFFCFTNLYHVISVSFCYSFDLSLNLTLSQCVCVCVCVFLSLLLALSHDLSISLSLYICLSQSLSLSHTLF